MRYLNESLLCLDLGNTTCKIGIWKNGKISKERIIPTHTFVNSELPWLNKWSQKDGIAYCSVVPNAESSLLKALVSRKLSPYSLTASTQSILPIGYPKPEEIGADRIANAIAVYQNFDLPAVVIDLGTATTFDVVTANGGYEGGVIIPGPQGMLDFLGNNTALLPTLRLSPDKNLVDPIGKSTCGAIQSGLNFGYPAMLQGILNALEEQLEQKHGKIKSLIQTGGESNHFQIQGSSICPYLTLEGLGLAFANQQV
ncbi:MAG: type III pantothenate kinase [Opitutales bacterium]|nr:type III pantothenate kinase [Opitutales bacterium]